MGCDGGEKNFMCLFFIHTSKSLFDNPPKKKMSQTLIQSLLGYDSHANSRALIDANRAFDGQCCKERTMRLKFSARPPHVVKAQTVAAHGANFYSGSDAAERLFAKLNHHKERCSIAPGCEKKEISKGNAAMNLRPRKPTETIAYNPVPYPYLNPRNI